MAFSNIRNFQPGTAFFPALSISHGERSELNFGSQPFRYAVAGFQPIQVMPSCTSCDLHARITSVRQAAMQSCVPSNLRL